MNDYFIPSVSPTSLSLLLAYLKDKLPDKEVDIDRATDVTIRNLGYVQQDELTAFIEIMNNMENH